MEQKIATLINKGMQQDYSVSKSSNEFAYKNHNIRITTRGENSLLTVTNEKSNKGLIPKEKEIIETIVSKGVKELKYSIIERGVEAHLMIKHSGDTIRLDNPLHFIVFNPKRGIQVVVVDKLNNKPIGLGFTYNENLVVVLAHKAGRDLIGYLDYEKDANIVDQVFKQYGCHDVNNFYNIECFFPSSTREELTPSRETHISLTRGTTTSGYYNGKIPDNIVKSFKFVYNTDAYPKNTIVTNVTSISVPLNALLKDTIYLGYYYDSYDKYDLIFKNVGIMGVQESEPTIQYEEIITNTSIKGVVLGTCVTNDSIILFTKHSDYDYIIQVKYDEETDSFNLKTLYYGNLNFSLEHPIETLYNYESDTVEKVYWVDGINQPRLINIKGAIKKSLDTQFDFNPTIANEPYVQIEKNYSGDGLFKPGVIQYLITYYNNYAQETAPVYVSPLYYISEANRGADVEQLVSNSFTIRCNNLDTNWDNIVLYSLHRSAKDSTVLGYKVKEYNLTTADEDTEITFIDNGTNLESIDPSRFFFENDSFIPGTLSKKADKIFFGDLKTKDDISDLTFALKDETKLSFVYDIARHYPNEGGLYDYSNQLAEGEHKIKTFKGGEKYRFALQLQDNKGIWSSPLYIGDVVNDLYPKVNGNLFEVSKIKYTNTLEDLKTKIPNFENYSRCRLLMVEPTDTDRSVVAQGIISPTVYNMNEVVGDTCHYINSWIQRFTSLDEHLHNVNKLSFYGSDYKKLRDITQIETPLEYSDDSGYEYLDYDIAFLEDTIEENENDDSSPYAVQITQIVVNGFIIKYLYIPDYTAIISRYNSRIELYLENIKVKFTVFSKDGRVIDLKEQTLNISRGGLEEFDYKLPKAKNIQKYLYDDYLDIVSYQNIKFSDEVFTKDDKTVSVFGFIKNSLGKDIKILNVNEDDFLDPDFEYKLIKFDSIIELATTHNDFREDIIISNNYPSVPPSVIAQEQLKSKNQYFVNSNVFSLFSPDIKNTNYSDLKFRIVGCSKLRHNISDYQINVDKQKGNKMQLHFNTDDTGKYLRSHFLYHITNFYSKEDISEAEVLTGPILMSLWQKSGPLSNYKEENILNRKVIGNLWYCDSNYYADSNSTKILWEDNKNPYIKIADAPIVSMGSKIYKKDYESLLFPVKNGFSHIIKNNATVYDTLEELETNFENSEYTYKNFNDSLNNSCLIKYNSEDHVILQLQNNKILPGYANLIIDNNVQMSTGLPIVYAEPKDMFLPFPIQCKLENGFTGDIPDRINLNLLPLPKSFVVPSLCKCVVVFWTEEELRNYVIDTAEIENSYVEDAIEYLLSYFDSCSLIAVSSDIRYQQIGLAFIQHMIKTRTNARIAIYENASSLDLKYNQYITNQTLKKYSDTVTKDGFINLFDDYVGVYQINSIAGMSFNDLGFTSFENTKHAKAYIKDNLPVFIYDSEYTIPDGNDYFKYNIRDKYWVNTPCIWIGELYRDNPNAYGGDSNNSVYNNTFIPCGETVDIDHSKELLSVDGTIGDTYFQRWDCLRTYPTTEEDINSIIDVVSTMVETHTNIDGRYDNTRGRSDIANIRPSNINLINPAYTQNNNFFTYHAIDSRTINKSLSNYYTWSLSKINNELVDNWTKGLMVNTEMVDGAKGKITKLQLWRDYLLVFQERGIARIHYNDQTTMGAVEGVPVEILNSTTVSGHNYLSELVGCTNKWSIAVSEAGIYFVDSVSNSINLFNGKINNLTYNKAFKDWSKENLNDLVWNPNNKKAYYGTYDRFNHEYYITNEDNCLCFSEDLDSFVSFYDYTKSPMMISFRDKLIGIQNKENDNILWEQFAGDDYCNFYGEQKGYSVEFNVNQDPISDKIFNNIEYRANVKDMPDETFDNLIVKNEYQYGELLNINSISKHKYPNSEKKYRIWRLDIPRDKNSKRGNDRIRNPWIKLKLEKTNNTNKLMEMHDLLVKYYL